MESIEKLKVRLETAKQMMQHNLEGYKGGWLGNTYLYWKTQKESIERQIKIIKKNTK